MWCWPLKTTQREQLAKNAVATCWQELLDANRGCTDFQMPFKVLVISYKALRALGPEYLKDLLDW